MTKGTGKKKIDTSVRIEHRQHRLVSFCKRRDGLFKKAAQLSSMSGAQIAVIVRSQAGRFYIGGATSSEAVVQRFLKANPSAEDESALMSGIGTQQQRITSETEEMELNSIMNFDVESCSDLELLQRLMQKLEGLREKIWSRHNQTKRGRAVIFDLHR